MQHKLYKAKVMHKRLFPKENKFVYSVYYYVLSLSSLKGLPVPYNRFGLTSFHDKDHGAKDGSSLEQWARDILETQNLNDRVDGEICLISMPRILGYVFNPVSFWLCFDKQENLRAVICEVNNTFGETHSYLCAHPNGNIIENEDILEAHKLFHVSPFLERKGHYNFRFSLNKDSYGIWINYFDEYGKKKLLTSLAGTVEPLTKRNASRTFWSHPLVTLKTIFLIHYQALKLCLKGISYFKKPKQREQKLSHTHNITKI